MPCHMYMHTSIYIGAELSEAELSERHLALARSWSLPQTENIIIITYSLRFLFCLCVVFFVCPGSGVPAFLFACVREKVFHDLTHNLMPYHSISFNVALHYRIV